MAKHPLVPVGQNVWYLAGFIDGVLRCSGPTPSKDIARMAEASGYSWSTMQRAKKLINVISYRDNDAWYWALSPVEAEDEYVR